MCNEYLRDKSRQNLSTNFQIASYAYMSIDAVVDYNATSCPKFQSPTHDFP